MSVTLTVRIDLDLGESDIEELKTLLAEHAGDHCTPPATATRRTKRTSPA